MKKFCVAIAITAAFIAGSLFGLEFKTQAPDWEYQRGIGATEVVADYDRQTFSGDVYYEIWLWDEEYENHTVVETGHCKKEELNAMSEFAHAYEAVYQARF